MGTGLSGLGQSYQLADHQSSVNNVPIQNVQYSIDTEDIRLHNNSIINLCRPSPKARQRQISPVQRLNGLAGKIILEVNTRRHDKVAQSINILLQRRGWLGSRQSVRRLVGNGEESSVPCARDGLENRGESSS